MKMKFGSPIILLCAGVLLALAGCPSPLSDAVTGGRGPSNGLPADQAADVVRFAAGDFTFETLLPVSLNLRVNLYNAARAKLAPDSADVIATLRDSMGNVVYSGKVQADGTLHGVLRIPAAPEDMTLTLSGEGVDERRIVLRDVRRYSEVNRTIGLTAATSSARSATTAADRDGDGVPDVYDAFPDDPASAFAQNVPADGPLTVAFEDLYLQAQAGDADYNDLVAQYQLTIVTNAENKVVQVKGRAQAVAKLAGYNHRFGIFFGPFSGDARLDVTRYNKTGQPLSGDQGNHRKVKGQADIILFQSTRECIGRVTDFSLSFETPQEPDQIDQPPYDPYLYVYNTGYDIHLIGESPLPGSRNPAGSSFRDAQGFPWALLVPSAWKNPDEGQRIEIPYPRFTLWRESMGTQFTDWYLHYYDPYTPPPPPPVGPVVERAADIYPGAGSSSPANPLVFGGTLYFSANDGSSGTELWKFAGTTASLAADINPAGSSFPSNLCELNGALYFSASDGSSGTELWKFAGTSASRVADINPLGSSNPTYLTAFGLKLYFQATSDGTAYPLFAYDGVDDPAQVTTLVYPQYLQAFGGLLYMGASDSSTTGIGRELYRTDGSTVTLVKDINPSGDSLPARLTVFGNLLCFSANDGTSTRLWKSDGTAAGTAQADPGKAVTPGFAAMAVYAGALYFAGSADDGSTGLELWKYDGSSVSLVKDLNPGSGDGVAPFGMGVFDGALYFAGDDGSGSGYELWKYDGSSVSLVKGINPGAGSSFPGQFAEYNSRLFFQANDGTSGAELWMLQN